jgi:N-methylhydantoinase B/oxoprolinase/acetone carboxylase alpha subunit
VSFARMSETSDVYVLSLVFQDGITCMCCKLTEKKKIFVGPNQIPVMIHQDTVCNTPEEAVEHLKAHVAAGHKVEKETFEDLEKEIPLWFRGTETGRFKASRKIA